MCLWVFSSTLSTHIFLLSLSKSSLNAHTASATCARWSMWTKTWQIWTLDHLFQSYYCLILYKHKLTRQFYQYKRKTIWYYHCTSAACPVGCDIILIFHNIISALHFCLPFGIYNQEKKIDFVGWKVPQISVLYFLFFS